MNTGVHRIVVSEVAELFAAPVGSAQAFCGRQAPAERSFTIVTLDPEGKGLGPPQLPHRGDEPRHQVCATHLAFGDADNKGFHVTACMDLCRLEVAGVRPGPQ